MTPYAADQDHVPPVDGPDNAELAADDAAYAAAMDEIRHNEEVSKRLAYLRVDEDARRRLRAEKVTETNFADQYLTPRQLRERPRPEPLIQRVLPRNAYVIVRGRDQSFKSFLVLDWALCLATGKAWQQRPVEQTRVLYIAGEGATGLTARIDAWEYGWQDRVPDDMFTIRQTALNLHQPGPAFDHLLEHVRGGSYGLVIVDTLRRVSGAADGNSSEMGLVIDHLDMVKQATDHGSVLVVAHTDKGDNDTRGYSGIEDDADVVWSVKRDEMYLKASLSKMKDGPDGTTIDLEAQPMNGSLLLAGTDGPDDTTNTESQDAILEALRIMPSGGVSGTELRATAELGKSTFYRALKVLTDSQRVVTMRHKGALRYDLPGLLDTDDEGASPDDSPAPEDDQLTLDEETP